MPALNDEELKNSPPMASLENASPFNPVSPMGGQQIASNTLPPPAVLDQTVPQNSASSGTYQLPPIQRTIGTTVTPIVAPEVQRAASANEEAINKHQVAQEQLISKQTEADMASLDAQKSAADLIQAQSQSAYDEEKTAQAKNAADLQQRIKAIDANITDLSKTKFHNYFDDKSTGTKILAAFSIGLGGIGAGLTGGPNRAWDMINKFIDNDSARQVAQFNANKSTIETMKSSLDTARQMGLDQQQQRTYINSIKMVNLTDQLAANLAKIKVSNPTVYAKQMADITAAKQKAQQDLVDLTKATHPDITQTKQNMVLPISEVTGPANELREKYLGRKEIQDYQTASPKYSQIMNTDKTSAGDITRLFGYAQLIDPRSVVNDNQVDLVQARRSLGQKFVDAWNLANSGTPMSDEQRADIQKNATGTMADLYKNVEKIKPAYTKMAKSSYIDPQIIEDALPPIHQQYMAQQIVPGGKQKVAGQPGIMTPMDAKMVNWAKANQNDPNAKIILQHWGINSNASR